MGFYNTHAKIRFSPVGTGNTNNKPLDKGRVAVQPRGYGEHSGIAQLMF